MPDLLTIACVAVTALHRHRPLASGWHPLVDIEWTRLDDGAVHASARPTLATSIEVTAEPGTANAWWQQTEAAA